MGDMENIPASVCETVAGPAPGGFRWRKLLVWLPVCAAIGLLAAWAVVVARAYAAPLAIFPLMAGILLGGAIVLLMRVLDVGHRPTIWLGALLAGLLTVAGQHCLTFWEVRQDFAREPERLVRLRLVAPEKVPPDRFWEFMSWSASRGLPIGGYTARDGFAWLVWSIDGLLLLVPAMVLVGATARLPYCDRCGRWYHPVRSGRIDSATALRLSDVADFGLGTGVERVRYRLLQCLGNCGPAGLALSGDDDLGHFSTGVVWLSAAVRRQVVEILDQYAASQAEADATADREEGPS